MRGDNQAAAGDVVVFVLLLLAQAAASSGAAAVAVDAYSGRVVVGYAHHRRHAAAPTAEAAALMRRGRLLEDEVAPELAGSSGLTPGPGGGMITNSAFIPDHPACGSGCAGHGQPYTEGCKAIYWCRSGQ